MNALQLVRKALKISAAGDVSATIGDFLPDPLAAEVIDFIRERNQLRRLLNVFTMTSRTWRKPKRATGGAAFHVPDGVTVTGTDFTTSNVLWEAKKLMAFYTIDEEAFEDSLPNLMQQIMMDAAEAMAEAEENVFLNGDVDHLATAPLSSATEANFFAQDPRIMFDGIFVKAEDPAAATNVDGGGGAFDKEMINTALFNLGKFGRVKSRIIGLLPSTQASNVRSNSDFHDASATGLALAFFINGAGSAGEGEGIVTMVYGVRLYETPLVSSTHESQIAIFDRTSPEIGDRRRIKLATDETIEADQRKMVWSERIAFNFNYVEALTKITNLGTTIVS